MDSMNAIPSWPRRYRVHRIHSRTRGLLYRSRRDRHDELRVQQDGGVMIARVDGLLDRITMYRLVLWYLVTLLLCALALGTLHVIAINPVALALSAVLVLAGGWIANQVFARIFGAQRCAQRSGSQSSPRQEPELSRRRAPPDRWG